MMTYLCSAKETFDEIALNLYGDEQYASVLLEANPQLAHKIMMDGGEVMRAPEITTDNGIEQHGNSPFSTCFFYKTA